VRIRIVVPIITTAFNAEVLKEAAQFAAPDVALEVVNIRKGPASIESGFDEMLAAPAIVEEVVRAEKEACDGVFIDCFGDPGVVAAREMVEIPVVGAFQPAALTACALAGRWSVITVLKNVVPMLRDLARRLGVESNIASVRDIDTPVLELQHKEAFQKRLLAQIDRAVSEDGAEAVVLGCTGMSGVARRLQGEMAGSGKPVPVIDPTAAALGYLQLAIRGGLAHSKLCYRSPPAKERRG
jgi:allantoin racemase